MTPTQEQIKADAVSLLPDLIMTATHYYTGESVNQICWKDTREEITSREWLMVAHEAVASMTHSQRHEYAVLLGMHFWPNGWSNWECTIQVSQATENLRLEFIHRVCFPEKWRGA